MTRLNTLALCLATLCTAGSTVFAATSEAPAADDSWCGTGPSLTEQAQARHRYLERRADRRFAAATAGGRIPGFGAAEVSKQGNVAVVVADARVLPDASLVDLDNFGIKYKWNKRREAHKMSRFNGGFNMSFGDRLELDDDDTVEIELPFNLRFFGVNWSSIWVNSDGSVTFGEGDVATSERDLGRFLGGPPRIAAFFQDLDPSSVAADAGVYVAVGNNSVRVTWYRVPQFGTSDLNSFQLTAFRKGRVQLRFGEMESDTGVVGISPGGGDAGLELLDYTEELPAPFTADAVAESFSEDDSIDVVALSNVFLEKFEDRYSHLVLFTDFFVLFPECPSAIACAITFNNDVRGIGRRVADESRFWGSEGALQTFVIMKGLVGYDDDVTRDGFFGGVYSPVDILLHEIGHRWLFFPEFRRGGQDRQDLLGRGRAHWSFCADSDNSLLEGNNLQDNGDGSFTTLAGNARYSALDQYLMGLRAADEVPDLFYASGCDGEQAPEFDVSFPGTRQDVTIDDILKSMGPRRPSVDDSPKEFNVAFILLAREGQEPSQESIDKVDDFRKAAEENFEAATDGRGSLGTRLELR